GMDLFILSSNNRKNIDRCLARYNITDFRAVRTASGLFSKARYLKRMVRRFRIDSSSAVYIGDELRDVEAAHAAGLQAIAVTWGYDDRPLLETGNPDHIADTVEELRALLLPASHTGHSEPI
ncbi:MAG: HAD hydrolase-like protein, partial [Spirochaetota bacterium]